MQKCIVHRRSGISETIYEKKQKDESVQLSSFCFQKKYVRTIVMPGHTLTQETNRKICVNVIGQYTTASKSNRLTNYLGGGGSKFAAPYCAHNCATV